MQIDLRQPTIVIAGAFNPAIFVPSWIAAILFEVPEGQDVEGVMVQDVSMPAQRFYIGNVGIAVEQNRLSIFVDTLEADDLQLAEKVARNVSTALPHTPVGGFGINFQISHSGFGAEIADIFAIRDKPERIGQVLQTTIASTIVLDGNTILNLSRLANGAEFVSSLNYHYHMPNFSSLADLIDGAVTARFANAKETLELLYGLDFDDIEVRTALNNREG